MAQGLVNRVLNKTWIHSCLQFECCSIWLWVLYRGYSLFFLEYVHFSLLYPSLIFDIFLSLCVCVYVCVSDGVVLGFTNSHFSSLCVSVYLGDFFVCVWQCGFKFTGNSSLFFSKSFCLFILCICIHLYKDSDFSTPKYHKIELFEPHIISVTLQFPLCYKKCIYLVFWSLSKNVTSIIKSTFFFVIFKKKQWFKLSLVVVMPRTILPRRNRRCALSATGTRKPEKKDARGVTYLMEENVKWRDLMSI